MKNKVTHIWYKCTEVQPEEDGTYMLYIPEPHNIQVVAQFKKVMGGTWYIPQIFQETAILFGPGMNCSWTNMIENPGELDENINTPFFIHKAKSIKIGDTLIRGRSRLKKLVSNTEIIECWGGPQIRIIYDDGTEETLCGNTNVRVDPS